jgi:Zn-dependent membrane protease YugP
MVAPFVGALTRTPSIGIIMFAAGFFTLATSTLVHLATLPDRPHARRLLTAAALTYVSASLMSLLNIARWWAILRR